MEIINATINKGSLCADFTVVGDIPHTAGSGNDPVTEIFVAVRNQYRNVIPITLLPPERDGGEIHCHLLPSCVAHYTEGLPEKFELICRNIFSDMGIILGMWQIDSHDLYVQHYNAGEYKECDEVTEDFIGRLGLAKAPAICRSMLVDLISQLADGKAEEVLKIFEVSERQTMRLLMPDEDYRADDDDWPPTTIFLNNMVQDAHLF